MYCRILQVSLASGQTEVKMEFPLPIVACNLMIEYADLYENVQATSETLQCPRCSASVPANPGVCGNCGENVFQCHKCRSAEGSFKLTLGLAKIGISVEIYANHFSQISGIVT